MCYMALQKLGFVITQVRLQVFSSLKKTLSYEGKKPCLEPVNDNLAH